MKSIFIPTVLALVSSLSLVSAEASQGITKITKVLFPIGRGDAEKALVYTKDKRVFSIPKAESQLIYEAKIAASTERWVAIEFEEDRLISLQNSSKPKNEKPVRRLKDTFYDWYQPTQFSSVDELQFLMDELRIENMDEDSQCYWRAHYWTHSLWRDYDIRSEKIFIVFGAQYRNGAGQWHSSCKFIKDSWEREECDRKKFKSVWTGKYSSSKRKDYFQDINIWHFHVAPLLTAGGVDYVLDPAFNYTKDPKYNPDSEGRRPGANHLNRPTTEPRVVMKVDDWTNMFVNSHRKCKWVSTYSEANSRARDPYEREHCFLVRVPMYYFGLNDLDNPGNEKPVDTWSADQVKKSCDARSKSGCGHWDKENKRAEGYMDREERRSSSDMFRYY